MTIKYQINPMNTADQRRVHGCDQEYFEQVSKAVATKVPQIMADDYDTPVSVVEEMLHSTNKAQDRPVQIFSYDGQDKFAKVMAVYQLDGETLDIKIVLYGKPSRNFKKSQKQKFGAKENEAILETLFYMNTGTAINAVLDEHME